MPNAGEEFDTNFSSRLKISALSRIVILGSKFVFISYNFD
jgi:hypothetical protein